MVSCRFSLMSTHSFGESSRPPPGPQELEEVWSALRDASDDMMRITGRDGPGLELGSPGVAGVAPKISYLNRDCEIYEIYEPFIIFGVFQFLWKGYCFV